MSPTISWPDPPYLQVVKHIRAQIESGELRDGDAIPSARKLSSDWSISLATATKVLTTLRSEGYVRGVRGVGTLVDTSSFGHAPRDRMRSMRRGGRIYPPDQHAEIRSAEIVEATQQVADALAVNVGAPVIRRHRVTYQGEDPVSASVSWFDGELAKNAPRLLETTRLPQGTPAYIAEVTGRQMASGHDQKAADAATEGDAEDLKVPVGSPVLRGRNWVYDTAGGVIEYGESVSAAGRWVNYEYQITS